MEPFADMVSLTRYHYYLLPEMGSAKCYKL